MTPPWRFKMLTPTAARWLDDQVPALEELTGHPVRSRYKLPKDPDVWPPADVAVLAPATFNTINQWALGITEKIRRRIRGRGNRQGHPCDHHALRERRIRAAHPVPPEHCRPPRHGRSRALWGGRVCSQRAGPRPTGRVPMAPHPRRGRVSHRPTRCRPNVGHRTVGPTGRYAMRESGGATP
jgi:hypothetical protein